MFDFIEDMWDYACDNPVKSIVMVGGTALTVAAMLTPAGQAAAIVGKLGLLGQAGTGTRIATLTGAVLEKASLAAIGNGTIASGGGGILAGKAAVETTLATVAVISGTTTAGIAAEEIITG